MPKIAEIRIGTSGWHYRHWAGCFYPERCGGAAMFRFYLEHFDTVELNNSFYKLPDLSTFESWRKATPRNFRFAVKASRFITHNKKLKDSEPALERFLPRAEVLREKLGPVLFQLPPHWQINVNRLESFLSVLPPGHRYAFEFREPSWNHAAVYELLRRYNAAFCIYELAGYQSPIEITADWCYVRLHGPGGKYQGSYSRAALAQWARRIRQWAAQLKAIYVYFDNDQAGYAPANALELKQVVAEELAAAPPRKPPQPAQARQAHAPARVLAQPSGTRRRK
jgi:uncharacterized protein YecE (DUF72 family)